MAEEKMTYFLVTVVAIVAMVGMVTMFMMSAGISTTPAYLGSLGEQILTGKASINCQQLEQGISEATDYFRTHPGSYKGVYRENMIYYFTTYYENCKL